MQGIFPARRGLEHAADGETAFSLRIIGPLQQLVVRLGEGNIDIAPLHRCALPATGQTGHPPALKPREIVPDEFLLVIVVDRDNAAPRLTSLFEQADRGMDFYGITLQLAVQTLQKT